MTQNQNRGNKVLVIAKNGTRLKYNTFILRVMKQREPISVKSKKLDMDTEIT